MATPDAGATTSVPASTGAPARTPRPTGGGVVRAGAGARGVTDSTVEVGIWTINTAATNAVATSLTGNPGNVADPNASVQAGAQAVVDYVNEHGGVAGRQIVPVYHEVNVANTANPSGRDQEAQRACAAWTEDRQVFAFMSALALDMLDCAKTSNTMVLSDLAATGQIGVSRDMFETYSDVWYSMNSMITERIGTALVHGLWDAGRLTAKSKVAILIDGGKAGARHEARNAIVPALAGHGLEPVIQIEYPDAIEAPWQNYVLQLKAAGADHVLWTSSPMQFWGPYFALQAADNQKYYPKWGLSSYHLPYELAVLGTPRSELAGISGIGWLPIWDVGDLSPQSPNGAVCHKIRDDDPAAGSALAYCESLFFLQYVLGLANEVSLFGADAALGKVGDSFGAVSTIGGATAFAPGRHDGVSTYRLFTFDDRCQSDGLQCFKYASPPRSTPSS